MSSVDQHPSLAELSKVHPRHQEGNLPWVQNQHVEERCVVQSAYQQSQSSMATTFDLMKDSTICRCRNYRQM